MVDATDEPLRVKVVQVGDTKTHRCTCLVTGCDWMETAGSLGAATRKKNAHLADHRLALHGPAGVPTIMDAIEETVQMPEGAFREAVPVVENAEELHLGPRTMPTADPAQGVYEITRVGDHEKIDPKDGLPPYCGHCSKALPRGEYAEWPCKGSMIGFPTETIDGVPLATEEPQAEPKPFVSTPAAWGHTQQTPQAPGPDYCAECSEAAQDWVPWPCPAMATDVPEVPLAVVLTKARIAAQAGPSDADKDLPDSKWHEARAQAVSATLAAKLGHGGDIDYVIAREVRERINETRFYGNAYTRWGREREPFLEQVGEHQYGIVGEDRLFYSRANPRHVCSPDGIGIHPVNGRVRLGEYKTSGKELGMAQVKANGYYDQVQWQLYVMEADHAYLIWERREGTRDQYDTYVPQVGGSHLIMRDEARIAELVRRADLFLEALDVERERLSALSPEEIAAIDPNLKQLVHNLLVLRGSVKQAEEALREYCDTNELKSLEIPGLAKVSYSWGSPRATFDREWFDSEHPGLYEKYQVEGKPPERPTLRVTAKSDDGV